MAASTNAPVWLLTGCSSGFGYALAQLVASQGHRVIATSRNPSKTPEYVSAIEALGGKWAALDVTAPEDALAARFKELEAVYGRIDVLVNNAGYSILGAVEDISLDQARAQLETNFFGPMAMVKHALPSMRARSSGTIVNVSSVAGICPLASSGLYAASKHALEALSESLAMEVKPFGIRVLIIEPGAFRTNFLAAQGREGGGGGGSQLIQSSEPYLRGPTADVLAKMAAFDGNQPGDVQKGVQAIFDIVTETGEAGGNVKKEGFLRVMLGQDCIDRVKAKADELNRTANGQVGWSSKTAIA